MSEAKHEKPKINLKKLPFSPTVNPLLDGFVMKVKNKQVLTGRSAVITQQKKGQGERAVIMQDEALDDATFVKVFATGIRAAFNLSLTGTRVFQVMLEVYERQPLSGGFAESIYLHVFNGGLDGRKLDMSERTFRRGLIELLESGFIAPRGENLFWVNPSLFFKGDRAIFIKTFHRRTMSADEDDRAELEKRGQQRLID